MREYYEQRATAGLMISEGIWVRGAQQWAFLPRYLVGRPFRVANPNYLVGQFLYLGIKNSQSSFRPSRDFCGLGWIDSQRKA